MKGKLIILVFAVMWLAGCNKDVKNEVGEVLDATPEAVSEDSRRYKREEIAFMETIKGTEEVFVNFTNVPGESIEFFTTKLNEEEEGKRFSMEYFQYILQDDGTWDKKEMNNDGLKGYVGTELFGKNEDGDPTGEKGAIVHYFVRGRDGILYALGCERDYDYLKDVYKSENVTLFSLGKDGETFDKLPIGNNLGYGELTQALMRYEVCVFSNGDLLVQLNNEDLKMLDGASGEKIMTFDQGFTKDGYDVGDGELYNIDVLDNRFNVYDANTGNKTSSADYTLVTKRDNDLWSAIRTDDGIYVADNMGIHHTDEIGTNAFTRIISSVDYPEFSNCYIIEFMIGKNNELFALLMDENADSEETLYKYSLEEE